MIHALAEAGFDGDLVVERIGLPPGRDRLPASQCSWRDVLSAR
jgi:hypothetical protein